MRFDIRQKRVRPKIYLAKPNETTITRLSEARQETEIFRGGQLNELSFVLPLKHQTLEENKANIHAQMVRERMLIKLVKGTEKRYYIISNLSFDNDSKLVTVSAKSRGYSLSDIPIKGFTTIDNEHPDGLDYSSWTLSEIVRATIDRDEDTPWKLGDVDVDFDLKRREFSFDGSLGELTLSVAEKFGAIVEYDDVNFLIHFRHPEKIGVNRGLKITERNYLKTLNKESNSDSMVTQMSLYGKDGLTIHEISPTGSPYIEDFSHFLYPYEEDTNGNIIQSSYFMSDSLAKAMVTYNRKITILSPDFEDFLTQLDGLMDDIRELEDSISNKKIELTQKQEQIDIYLALHNGDSDATLESEKQTIQAAIDDLQSSVDSLKGEVELIAGADYYDLGFIPVGVQGGQLGQLKEQMLVRNNFTPEQIAERSHFIIRKEWSNDAITDVRDLMEEGKKALKEAIKPSISMTTSVVNFLNIVESDVPIEEMYMWDTIRVEQPWNKEVAEAKVIAFTVNHDTQELSLEIANIKDNNNGVNEFLSMLYQSSFAATVVNENRYKWDLSKENNGQINALIEQNFDAVKKKVSGGVAGLTEFSNRGLISRDYEDQNKYLVIQNGILATTNNNGVTWGHAITPTGIVAERLYGKVIAGVNLTIEDRDGIFRILGNKASVSNRLGEEVVKLGLISNEGETERFGFVVDNRKNQVGIVDGEGFYISRYQNGSLEKLLWTDANGNLNAQKITATSMTVVGGDLASAVVKNSQGIPVVSFGSFGMTVEGGSIAINGGTNGIRLNNSEGLVSENTKTLVTLNATSGMKIRNKNTSQDVFWIDTNGKLNVRDIVINSGSITWGSVNSQPMPNTSWDSLQGKPTYLGSDRIWSPLIQGGTIESGTFSSGTITGNTITGGTISGTTITGTTISGNTITGGSISGTTITGTSSISIGKFSVLSSGTVIVGASSNGYELASDGLFFQKSNGSGYIYHYGSSMEVYASGNLNLTTGSGSVRVNSSNIATESWVSNNYAGRYHSHSEYVTTGSSVYFSALGVGGSYQNSTNPSNTSIGASNIFVPNAVYAKGVALTSSVIYKTNIKPIPDGALSVVNDVNIYEYHYQKDIDELNFENKQIGVLAEAVPAILRGGENKSVNAYAMTSILWKAVQEQQQMIQTLETRIAELEEIQ